MKNIFYTYLNYYNSLHTRNQDHNCYLHLYRWI